MSIFHDEIEIEDFEYDEDSDTYFYPCPCGDQFQITTVSQSLTRKCPCYVNNYVQYIAILFNIGLALA